MRLLIDSHVPKAEACFAELGSITRLPGREIDGQAVRDAEAEVLVVRSITRVDEALLGGSKLRFVGTCTIGTDHVDQAALEARGIGFANAPGCNAEAVVDYVLSSLLTLAEREGVELDQRRIGIVGAGNVGGRLYRRLTELGLHCRVCDPPLAEQKAEPLSETIAECSAEEGAGHSMAFDDLDTLIDECDVLCLHTPLVRDGPHRTHHLLDEDRIAALAPGSWLLNAGRGDCVDGQALLTRLAARGDLRTVLDVFENEPAIDEPLFRLADIATPHIAGHSLDGKLRGTHQVYRAAMEHLGLPVRVALADLAPPPALPSLTLDAGLTLWEALRLCVRACYDVRRDHDGLRRYQRERGLAAGFDAYRSEYPLRREFSTLTIRLRPGASTLAPMLAAAGFAVHLEEALRMQGEAAGES
ncbi:4-phosphoerythronate dehydrogenase PdxB [Halomonas salinarum]|uniref:4-phosphoerythronate dehydrogenase PdxB n=1 Tax=Halomonas salinarum TaxID=1158993 RepID=UPI00143AFEA4|nr:4-phosphoerythronate dehydrogenase PdxB [Halomonas salinarum]